MGWARRANLSVVLSFQRLMLKKLHYLHVVSPQEDEDMRLFHFFLFTGGCSCMMNPSGCSGCRAVWRPRTGLKSRNAWKRCPHHHRHPSCAGFPRSLGLFQTPDNIKTQVSVIKKELKTNIPRHVLRFSTTVGIFSMKMSLAREEEDRWIAFLFHTITSS